jgi:methylmalonyl-CoA mutase N-terminal domain/subunit
MPKLYRNDAIKKIVHKNELWQKKAARGEKKHEKEFRSLSGLTIRPLYTPEDVSQLDYLRDLGFPGEEPFVRGIHPTMYRGRTWTLRQLAGFGPPEETNKRYKFLLCGPRWCGHRHAGRYAYSL